MKVYVVSALLVVVLVTLAFTYKQLLCFVRGCNGMGRCVSGQCQCEGNYDAQSQCTTCDVGYDGDTCNEEYVTFYSEPNYSGDSETYSLSVLQTAINTIHFPLSACGDINLDDNVMGPMIGFLPQSIQLPRKYTFCLVGQFNDSDSACGPSFLCYTQQGLIEQSFSTNDCYADIFSGDPSDNTKTCPDTFARNAVSSGYIKIAKRL